MLTFSRNLNLFIEDDLSTFFYEVTNSGHSLPTSNEDELKKVIHFGREFLRDSALRIEGGAHLFVCVPNYQLAIAS